MSFTLPRVHCSFYLAYARKVHQTKTARAAIGPQTCVASFLAADHACEFRFAGNRGNDNCSPVAIASAARRPLNLVVVLRALALGRPLNPSRQLGDTASGTSRKHSSLYERYSSMDCVPNLTQCHRAVRGSLYHSVLPACGMVSLYPPAFLGITNVKLRFTRDDWERVTSSERIFRLRRLAEEARRMSAEGPIELQRAYGELADHWSRIADETEKAHRN